MGPGNLTRFAWLSIAAAVLTIALKTTAYVVTGSVGLLSDTMESFVNLLAAIMALAMLTLAARPPDDSHAYGHSKAEYFSSAAEGALIVLAAASIAWTAVPRLITPQPLEGVGLGAVISALASAVNFGVARVLLRAGQKYHSITLEADARHLMTDVWTTLGVIIGMGAVVYTGYERLDPIIALLVAANIIWTGVQLLRRSALGLMDAAIPRADQDSIAAVLARYGQQGIHYHALRTRQAGTRKFISVHVLVPGEWTVQRGHQLLEELEDAILHAVTGAHVFTHLEPIDDPTAWHDIDLDRTHSVMQSQKVAPGEGSAKAPNARRASPEE
ncbi:MAG: cation-efflux pump [Desulfobulbaceae bacterium A2]|nr:MAG: cation-efflux pump [Desulfobulbaceae bacterium A2]